MPRISYQSVAHNHFARFLSTFTPYPGPDSWGDLAIAVGTVYLAPLEVPRRCTIERLGFHARVVAGNARVGLYHRGAIGNPDLPDGGAVVVQTGSQAINAAGRQLITIADTTISEGAYYIAVQGDNVGLQLFVGNLNSSYDGAAQVQPARTFNQVYGPFTDPCPATAGTAQFGEFVARVKSTP